MFENFYCFQKKPFQLAPDPYFLYKSEKHRHALTYLEYGLTQNVGIIVLTGEVGSGKTTSARYVLRKLGDQFNIALISNTNISSDQLLKMVRYEFELTPDKDDKADLLEILNTFFIQQYAGGRRTLLVIDEAQNLSASALEEIRMLSNLHSQEYALLQILLIGQSELLHTLKKADMRQFAQRVAVYFHLEALDREDTSAYIKHRLNRAGGKNDLFTAAALQMIFDMSGGIPRSINLICQAALVYGFAGEAQQISQDIIRQIRQDKIGVGITEAIEDEAPIAGTPLPRAEEDAVQAAIDNIRMEVKGRIQQMKTDCRTRDKQLLKQIGKLLVQDRHKTALLKQRIARLEKKLAEANTATIS